MSPIKAHVDNSKSKCADRYAPPVTGLKNQHPKNGEHIEESTLKDASHERNVGNKSVNRKFTWKSGEICMTFKNAHARYT